MNSDGWDASFAAMEDPVELDWIGFAKRPAMQDYSMPMKALGSGHIGSVFLVVCRENSKPYAMKVMNKDALCERKALRNAETERAILSQLQHPFLPSLHAHFETENYKVLVMDYCSGRDLNRLRYTLYRERFSVAAARFYAAEVVLALEYLHKLGIVYRDLKPENILIQCSGHITLTDFDLSAQLLSKTSSIPEKDKSKKKAHQASSSVFACVSAAQLKPDIMRSHCLSSMPRHLSTDQKKKPRHQGTRVEPLEPIRRTKDTKLGQLFSFVGTHEYVAPEMIKRTGHGFAVDWWALGILLYEMVYGKTPFKGSTRNETFHNILRKPPQFPTPLIHIQDLIQRLLAKDPKRRLGFCNGAKEVKSHSFFRNVQWDSLLCISRPPFVPCPFSLEKYMNSSTKNTPSLNLEEYLGAAELTTATEMTSSSRITSDDSSTPDSQSISATSRTETQEQVMRLSRQHGAASTGSATQPSDHSHDKEDEAAPLLQPAREAPIAISQ